MPAPSRWDDPSVRDLRLDPSPEVRPRLWRSPHDRMIAGVVGGLAEKFDIQPALARVLFVLLSISSAAFPGIIVYLVLWSITRVHDVPPEPGSRRARAR